MLDGKKLFGRSCLAGSGRGCLKAEGSFDGLEESFKWRFSREVFPRNYRDFRLREYVVLWCIVSAVKPDFARVQAERLPLCHGGVTFQRLQLADLRAPQ